MKVICGVNFSKKFESVEAMEVFLEELDKFLGTTEDFDSDFCDYKE